MVLVIDVATATATATAVTPQQTTHRRLVDVVVVVVVAQVVQSRKPPTVVVGVVVAHAPRGDGGRRRKATPVLLDKGIAAGTKLFPEQRRRAIQRLPLQLLLGLHLLLGGVGRRRRCVVGRRLKGWGRGQVQGTVGGAAGRVGRG